MAALVTIAAGFPVHAAPKTPVVPIALPAPPAGKGQIVFFRTGGIVGAAMGCSVNENRQKISSLGGGRYFVLVTDPGRHEYSVKSEATDTLPLEVEADETQFASCKIKMGMMVGRPDIRPATEAEFRAAKNLKLVDADDMGPGPGALRSEQIQAALAATPATTPAAALPQPLPMPASN
jgi:hypothetical protein